jgi:HrpA-like RNA helicase
VLLNVVEPPSEEAMENAMQRLQDVGALDEDEVKLNKIKPSVCFEL